MKTPARKNAAKANDNASPSFNGSLSDLMLKASPEERERVFMRAIEKSIAMQRKLMDEVDAMERRSVARDG